MGSRARCGQSTFFYFHGVSSPVVSCCCSSKPSLVAAGRVDITGGRRLGAGSPFQVLVGTVVQ